MRVSVACGPPLTAGVRYEIHWGGKEVCQQQWSLAKWGYRSDLLARAGQGDVHYLALPLLVVAGDTLKVDGLVIARLKDFLLLGGHQMKALW